MNQLWQTQGIIWDKTRAQAPFVHKKNDDIWRIYFSDRDQRNRSIIKYIDVEAGNPKNVLDFHTEPLLPLGELGHFDVSGTMVSCIIEEGNHLRMYYQGWVQRKDVPYYNSIGMAISTDGGDTFTKYSPGPIIGPIAVEPGFTGVPYIIRRDNSWLCYYLYCTHHVNHNGKINPVYTVYLAVSLDGIHWQRSGVRAIDNQDQCVARPCVMPGKDTYHMWYCYRKINDFYTPGNSYQIGYATSLEGAMWERKDYSVKFPEPQNWETQMRCYPHVIEHDRNLWMFYNGNMFGGSGVGYATLKLPDHL